MTEFRPESKISEVTVFESSAQVRRVVTIDKMPKGEVVVIFSDLPQNLDRDNVQVAVKFESGTDAASDSNNGKKKDEEATCSLRGVSFKTETVEAKEQKGTSEERERLEQQIKAKSRDLKDAEDELDDAKKQGAFFRDCATSALSDGRKEEDASAVLADVGHWKKMFKATNDADKDALAEQRAVEKKIAGFKEELAVLRTDLRERGGSSIATTKNVAAVTLVASRAIDDVDVRISYVVNQAKWTAEYDVRFDNEKCEAKVTYNAVVSQTGSEVWKNAILTISTARPTISGKPKELTPWHAKMYVPRPPPSPRRSGAMKKRGGPRSSMRECESVSACAMAVEEDDEDCDGDDGIAERLEDLKLSNFAAVSVETAKVKEGATSMSFHIDNHPYTVSNNGKAVRVTLAIVPVKSTVTYITRPKLTETVFARMKAVNLSEFTLLEGPALVFSGQQFISKTTLKRCAPSDDFTVNLGADNDVVVKYKKIKNERAESSGFFSGEKVKFHHAVKISVNNRKKTPIEISVEDQIPISQHSEIEVKLTNPAPPVEGEDDDYKERYDQLRQGKVIFDALRIAAQQEKSIPIEFSVQHPKNFEMEGL